MIYLLWVHRPVAAMLIGFIPPIVVSAVMIRWTPDLGRIKQSAVGRYLKRYMTVAHSTQAGHPI